MTDKKEPKPWEPESPEYTPPAHRRCSFCGTFADDSKYRLIAGPNHTFICEECLEICIRILAEENPAQWYEWLTNILIKNARKKDPNLTELIIPIPSKNKINTMQDYVESLNNTGKDWLFEFLSYIGKNHKNQKPIIYRQRPMYKKDENHQKGYLAFTAAKNHFSIHTLYLDLIEKMKTILPAARYGTGWIKVKYTDKAAIPELKKLCDRIIARFTD